MYGLMSSYRLVMYGLMSSYRLVMYGLIVELPSRYVWFNVELRLVVYGLAHQINNVDLYSTVPMLSYRSICI